MSGDFTSIVITGCLWYWTASKISITVCPLREENRWHRRLANIAFAILFIIQIASISDLVSIWGTSIGAAVVTIATLIFSKFDREGFWAKPRNQLVGAMSLLTLALTLPVVYGHKVMIPMFFALIVAHGFHKALLRQFNDSLNDLDSIRLKVTKLQADLLNARLEHSAQATSGIRPFPAKDFSGEARVPVALP